MKIKNIFFLMLITFGVITISCDDDPTTPQDSLTVKTTIFGTILDESNDPIPNTIIKIGSNNATTDGYGNFILKDATILSDNALITATKSGYFNGMRTFQPVANSVNNIKITLLAKTLAGTVSGSTGGDVTMADGTNIKLAPNGVMDNDGNEYTGSVNVYVKRLNPTADNILTAMPGDLTAENADGEERILETFGMLAVELQGSGGEELNVKTGTIAELTFPLDPAISGDAPTTIPLWFFDETDGLWKEEGLATLVGNTYVGEVSHFSFWNCDAPFPIVKITGILSDDGVLLAGVTVKVSRTNGDPDRPVGYGITDSSGTFCGKMPANETLLLEVLNSCNEVVVSQTIGPFTEDSFIGTIAADVSTSITTIVGTAVDCDENPLSNAYIIVKDGSSSTSYLSLDGSFSIPLIYCAGTTEIEVRVIDVDNQTESGWVTYPVSTPETNLGDVIACNSISEYVSYTINGTDDYLIYSNIQAGLDGAEYFGINARNTDISQPEYFNLNLYNTTIEVGTYTIEGQQQTTEGFIDFYSEVDSSYAEYTNITVEITELGNVDEIITGTVNGYILTYQEDSIHIDGSFNVIREY